MPGGYPDQIIIKSITPKLENLKSIEEEKGTLDANMTSNNNANDNSGLVLVDENLMS